jgi:hypothetical protein
MEKMKKLIAVLLIAASFNATAGIAFFKYERMSGMNKICVYDHLGSDVVITIASYKLCPLSISV